MLSQDLAAVGREMFSILHGASHIGIVGHQDPDGDCLGCMLALSRHFERRDKAHVPFCVDGDLNKWHFLPGSFRLERHEEIWRAHTFDVLIFFDTPDIRYAGLEAWLSRRQKGSLPFIINIDHHHDNDRFGDINIVIPDAPATAQILYDLFLSAAIDIDRHMATCLLCGLLIDTSHFSNAATTGTALETAAHLVMRGAHLPKLVRYLWQQQPLEHFSLWGSMLSRLTHHPVWDIVSTVMTHDEIASASDDPAGMANFLNLIGEGKCGMIVKESEPGIIKGSLRTTRDDIDVSRLARILGGGGHQKAAGFSLPGRLSPQPDGWRVF